MLSYDDITINTHSDNHMSEKELKFETNTDTKKELS